MSGDVVVIVDGVYQQRAPCGIRATGRWLRCDRHRSSADGRCAQRSGVGGDASASDASPRPAASVRSSPTPTSPVLQADDETARRSPSQPSL